MKQQQQPKLWYGYWVQCARCQESEGLTDKGTVQLARETATQLGWQLRERGWECPSCLSESNTIRRERYEAEQRYWEKRRI